MTQVAGVWAELVAAVTKKTAIRKGIRVQFRSQAPSESLGKKGLG